MALPHPVYTEKQLLLTTHCVPLMHSPTLNIYPGGNTGNSLNDCLCLMNVYNLVTFDSLPQEHTYQMHIYQLVS